MNSPLAIIVGEKGAIVPGVVAVLSTLAPDEILLAGQFCFLFSYPPLLFRYPPTVFFRPTDRLGMACFAHAWTRKYFGRQRGTRGSVSCR